MQKRASSVFAAAVLICMIPAAALAMTPYSQDFELLLQPDPGALANDGWVVYGNVFSPDRSTWLYGYGVNPAPNDGFGFCQIDVGQGGAEQGLQQLSIFSDFNNGDHALGSIIESNTFQEQTVEASDVGKIWIFEFQAKRGNLIAPSTALAFIKTIDPNNGYALTNFVTADMTTIPDTWGGYSVQLDIIPELVGQLFQFGFSNDSTNFRACGIFYDNVVFREFDPAAVPDASDAMGVTLRQNYPNPFNPKTRIEFVLEQPGTVDVSVFDLAGRRIATLQRGDLQAGENHVTWNGQTDSGTPAPAGQYRYVLKTSAGQISRSMVLLK